MQLTDTFPGTVGPVTIKVPDHGRASSLASTRVLFKLAMATAAVLSSRDVPTTLNYYIPVPNSEETPYQYVYDPPAGKAKNNIGLDKHEVIVRDARGKERDYNLSLDTSGFQFVNHVSQEEDFTDEERIRNVYYKEVEDLLKKEAGARRVFIFDHTIRLKPNDDNRKEYRGPVVCSLSLRGHFYPIPHDSYYHILQERVHIDQTYDASVARVYRHLGEDAERLLKGRVRIINVWRPIHHPVAHKPLAVSDWRHLDTEHDLVSVRHIYPDRVGGTDFS